MAIEGLYTKSGSLIDEAMVPSCCRIGTRTHDGRKLMRKEVICNDKWKCSVKRCHFRTE